MNEFEKEFMEDVFYELLTFGTCTIKHPPEDLNKIIKKLTESGFNVEVKE